MTGHRGEGELREGDVVAVQWQVLSSRRSGRSHRAGPPNPRYLLLQLILATLAVGLIAGLVGVLASRSFARDDAVDDGRNTVDLLAQAVVEPALTDPVLSGDPAALQTLDTAVRRAVLPHGIVRVKLWNAQGQIVYSDEPRLIGSNHPLDGLKLRALQTGETFAEISTADRLDPGETALERGTDGDLLEVYRLVRTPEGQPLLLEMYGDYAAVREREEGLLRVMLILIATTLAVMAALLSPLLWGLMRRLQAAARQREHLLQNALGAADEERRRIAGSLHDGPVQELAGSALIVGRAADRLVRAGQPEAAGQVRLAASTVRSSIASLRSLMVDIYPPKLSGANLLPVLHDLVEPLRAHGTGVHIEVADGLPEIGDRAALLIYRVVSECLRNVVKHAAASTVRIGLWPSSDGGLQVDIRDDGSGFDPERVLVDQAHGHLGLSVLADLASAAGAELALRSAPGAGTQWRLIVDVELLRDATDGSGGGRR